MTMVKMHDDNNEAIRCGGGVQSSLNKSNGKIQLDIADKAEQ